MSRCERAMKNVCSHTITHRVVVFVKTKAPSPYIDRLVMLSEFMCDT